MMFMNVLATLGVSLFLADSVSNTKSGGAWVLSAVIATVVLTAVWMP